MPILFDFSELKGRIISRFGNYAPFAEAIGLSRAQLSDRLNNKVKFQPEDICATCDVLDIAAEHIGRYFFTPKV